MDPMILQMKYQKTKSAFCLLSSSSVHKKSGKKLPAKIQSVAEDNYPHDSCNGNGHWQEQCNVNRTLNM